MPYRNEYPTLAAFKRLADAHTHWLQALESYFEPERFRLQLNACIQCMRSVTFLLQKNKAEISDFDSWYTVWQGKMKADPLMKWSVDARNRIVKQGDLKLHSMLRVSVVGSYLESEVPYVQYTAAAKLETKQIFRDVLKLKIPRSVLKHAYLQLERRWVENDLPDHELLTALAHCWEFLAKLLVDAPSAAAVKDSPYFSDSLPTCMVDSGDIRSLWIKFSTGETITLESRAIAFNIKDAEKAAVQYFGQDGFPTRRKDSPPTLRELAEIFFEQAKSVLKVDGYHILLVFLIMPDHSTRLLELRPGDQAEKYLLWRSIGLEVKRTGAVALIAISEVWIAELDRQRPYAHAAEREDRVEALQLVAISKDGEEIDLVAKFHRDGDAITFDEDTVLDKPGDLNFLAPVRDAWKIIAIPGY